MGDAKRQQVLATVTTNPQSPSPLFLRAQFPAVVYIGSAFNGTVAANGGAGANVYTVVSKPAWMTCTIIPGILVSCTGTAGASGLVTISVTDGSSTTVQKSWYVEVRSTISGPGGGVLFTSSPNAPSRIPTAYVSTNFVFDITTLLQNPVLPLTSSAVTTGTLPTGMSLASTTGIISASPVGGAATTQDVVIHVVDGAGSVADLPLHLLVKPKIAFSAFTLPTAVLGVDYFFQIPVTGGSGEYHIFVDPSGDALPSGHALDSATGKLTGRATALTPSTGPLNLKFTAVDLETGQSVTMLASKALAVASAFIPSPRGSIPAVLDNNGAPTAYSLWGSYFGDGVDGVLNLDGTTNPYVGLFTRVGSTYTQQRPIWPSTITFSANVTLDVNGWPVFASTNTDVSAANVHIRNSGTSAAGQSGAAASNSPWFAQVVAAGSGGNGAVGNGVAGTSPTPSPSLPAIGTGGSGGNGGIGSSGAAGAGAAGQTSTFASTFFPVRAWWLPLVYGFGSFAGGASGGGGGGGGGTGALAGANGAGAGGGGQILYWFTYTLTTSASTTALTFAAGGGLGAAGTASGGAGRGAGAGAGGGAGGIVWLVCAFRDGPAITNLAAANGGDGGNAGATGAGNAAQVGQGGSSGYVFCCCISSGTSVTAGINARSGQTGGLAQVTF